MQTEIYPTEAVRALRTKRFSKMKLGQLKLSLPLKELASLLPPPKTKAGRPSWFSNERKIALQFLKMHSGLSDAKLLSRINIDWTYQMFCGLDLGEFKEIKDPNIIWKTRKFVSEHLDIAAFQTILIKHWKNK